MPTLHQDKGGQVSNFDLCYPSLIKAEGGYVNNPQDPGGMTNLGVTRRAWEHWVGHGVAEADMRALTPLIVSPFYRAMYWNIVHGDELPLGLALCMFHSAVNSGPQRACILVQKLVKATPDGAIGPATLQLINQAVAARGEKALIRGFQDSYRAFYLTLKNFATFGHGWIKRADTVEAQALGMAK